MCTRLASPLFHRRPFCAVMAAEIRHAPLFVTDDRRLFNAYRIDRDREGPDAEHFQGAKSQVGLSRGWIDGDSNAIVAGRHPTETGYNDVRPTQVQPNNGSLMLFAETARWMEERMERASAGQGRYFTEQVVC
jgi:hypothetical protein